MNNRDKGAGFPVNSSDVQVRAAFTAHPEAAIRDAASSEAANSSTEEVRMVAGVPAVCARRKTLVVTTCDHDPMPSRSWSIARWSCSTSQRTP